MERPCTDAKVRVNLATRRSTTAVHVHVRFKTMNTCQSPNPFIRIPQEHQQVQFVIGESNIVAA